MDALPKQLGRYQVVGELGTGGMAEILLARLVGPSDFERPVVLKRILPHLARRESFVKMFLDEARIVARIRHRNVVQVQELVHEDNELFMVMEYLEGESVSAIIKRLAKRGDALDRALGAYVVAEACAGLHAAHEAVDSHGEKLNLVHRDVSPHNLFVTYDAQVKVLDFGIVKAQDRLTHTRSGMVKGKFAYMSPEQCRNEALDRRSDVFSLGTVLFEITTGRSLFERRSDVETIEAITSKPIVPPSRVARGYPPALEAICSRALARNRDERYATMEEMRRDLVAAARALRPGDELDQALSAEMGRLFADRMAEKAEMLRRIRGGSAPSVIPGGAADEEVDVLAVPPLREGSDDEATSVETPARTRQPARPPSRSTIVVVAVAAAAAALVAAAFVARQTRQPPPPPGQATGPQPAVVVSNFRTVWTTPNGIRWEWDVNDAPPDRFSSYVLLVAPTEEDLGARTAKVTVWDARRNPELGKFLLPRTGGVTKVQATITDGHEPSTDYYGQLVATDNAGRKSTSEIIRARTSDAADESVLFSGEGCNRCGFPDWIARGTERPFKGPSAYEGVVCCDENEDRATRVCNRTASCYQNLRIYGGQTLSADLVGTQPGRMTAGSFTTTAILELAFAHDSKLPSAWSEVWLGIGHPDGDAHENLWRFSPIALRADGNYRVVQIPLRALRNSRGRVLTYEELAKKDARIFTFNVGGGWTAGAHIRIDEVRLRW